MKIILIIIVAAFTVTCLGQSEGLTIEKIKAMPDRLFIPMTYENLIENYQRYTAECGETERCYEVYVQQRVEKLGENIKGIRIVSDTTYAPCGNNIDPGFTEGYKGTITKTIKNEPTFEGFMQFLVKKYGEE
jgi:hypothetical protein